MPKILEEMPAVTRSSRERKYPWNEWLDGKAREFEQGTDFDCTIRTFVGMAYAAARRAEVGVQAVRTGENSVALKMVKRTAAVEATEPADGEDAAEESTEEAPASRRRRK